MRRKEKREKGGLQMISMDFQATTDSSVILTRLILLMETAMTFIHTSGNKKTTQQARPDTLLLNRGSLFPGWVWKNQQFSSLPKALQTLTREPNTPILGFYTKR